jgi:RNA polymerase sigma-70 factor (ECF subfamily)
MWASLARRIGTGDREAESELARQFHARVRTMALVRLHGSDTATDIAQETILAVLEALRAGKLRELEKLPAYVLSVARNLINNQLREQTRGREVLEDPPDRPAGPDRGFLGLDDDRQSLVREALGRLSQLDRRILILTLVEGMTPREISPIVGLGPEAVRTRKARAVKAITGHIKKLSRIRLRNHIGKSGPRP